MSGRLRTQHVSIRRTFRDLTAEAQGARELLHRLDCVSCKLDPLLPAEQLQQYEHPLVWT
jgi:hypothetical protein